MKPTYLLRVLEDSNVVSSELFFTSLTKALGMASVLVKAGKRIDLFRCSP